MKKLFLIIAYVLLCFVQSLNAQWTQANGPFGGSIRSLAISGTSVYAGTNNVGGVFKSDNGGISWTQTELTNNSIYSLAISGTSVYAGTFSGVFKSDNGGTSWMQVNNGLTNTNIYSLAISGTSIYAGTYSGGVFKSVNGGLNWTQVNTGLTNTNVRSIAISANTVYVGTYGGGVFKSNNGGTSWTQINTGLTNTNVECIAISGTIVYAGTDSGVFKSDNSGTSWTQINNGMTTNYVNCLAVSDSSLYAGTYSGVFKSDNSGISWTQINNGLTHHDVECIAISGTNVYAGTNVGGVYKIAIGGTNWTQINTGLTNTDVRSLAISGPNVYAGTDALYKSEDCGANWTQTGLSTSVTSLVISDSSIYAGTYSGVYKSDNGGISWILMNSMYFWVESLAISGTNVYAGTYSGVFKSDNGGSSWTQINTGLTNTDVQCIAISGTNVYAGTNGGGVFKSTIGDTIWTQINSGLVNIDVRSIAISGNNIYAGTFGGGVFQSNNGGSNWTPINTGLTETHVYSLAVRGTRVYAGTYDGGVFMSDNSVTSWTPINIGLTNNYVYSLAFDSKYIYAGTHGSSVCTMPIVSVPVLSVPNPNANVILISKFTWTSTYIADYYQIQFASDSTFGNIIKDAITDTTFITQTLPNNSYLCWRVRAILGTDTSSWSVARYFNTTMPAPTLSVPSSNANIIPISKFTWTSTYIANHYQVQFASDSLFVNIINDAITDTTFITQTLPNNSRLYWRVRAMLGIDTSSWSAIKYFNTSMPIPTLSIPSSNANIIPISKFSWTSTYIADYYQIQFASDSLFGIIINDAIADTTFITCTLPNNSRLYWRVRAILGADTSNWSIAKYFNTNMSAPALSSPSMGSSIRPIAKYIWTSVYVANHYQVQFALDSTFGLIINEAIADTTFITRTLPNNSRIYWRVRAILGTDTSNWSSVKYFNTNMPAPYLSVPVSNANVFLVSTFSWTSTYIAQYYQVQFAADSTFGLIINEAIADTTFITRTLPNNSRLCWRVRAILGTDTSSWSGLRYFNTMITAPTLASPSSNATIFPISPFSWTSAFVAQHYQVQFATDSTFAIIINNAIVDTTFTTNSLPNNSRICWRVRAIVGSDTSNWSAIKYFNTYLPAPIITLPINAATILPQHRQFKWNTAYTATAHIVQYATDSLFTNIINEYNSNVSTISVAFPNNSTIYWRVKSMQEEVISPWSSVYRFNVSSSINTEVSIGSGTSSVQYPFYTYYMDSRTQILITASELYASGANPGAISKIGFKVDTAVTQAMSSFNIKMQPTTLTSVSGLVLSGWTSYYATANYTVPGTGWRYLELSQNYNWDGISNLLIDICFDNGAYTKSSRVYGTSIPNMTYSFIVDALSDNICTDTTQLISSNKISAVQAIRPNIRFQNSVTMLTPTIPNLVSPLDLTQNVDVTPTLTWDSVANATDYNVQVSTSITFDSLIINTETTNTNQLLTVLNPSTIYYWRVKALNGTLESDWSTKRSFTTQTIASTYTLSGTLKYANTARTAMNNCTIIIKNMAIEVTRTTTDANGNYSVSGLADGTYTIEVYTTKTSGGLNSLDGASLRKKIGNIISYTPIQILAGDINHNGNINSLDVAPLRQKIGNLTATNWRIANFVFYPTAVTINGENAVINILSLCGGDVNSSFTPSNN